MRFSPRQFACCKWHDYTTQSLRSQVCMHFNPSSLVDVLVSLVNREQVAWRHFLSWYHAFAVIEQPASLGRFHCNVR
ncbi:protein of unknown function [Rhodovastum atsumiense]|nr:protein of unknown function [Rhodovastum atsumiense]